jgi:hypothetical protein
VFQLTENATINGFTVGDSLKVYGSGVADSLLPASAIVASGVEVGESVTLVDGGYAMTSAGDIVIHDTATALSSTGLWSMTAAGTIVNRRPDNAFFSLYAAATCTDTIFLNPSSTNDSMTVTDSFNVTGTRGSTYLFGDAGGTLVFLPDRALASNAYIENVIAKNHVLIAPGCIPKGHMSGVLVRR